MKMKQSKIISMPITSPLYPPPPYKCEDSETIYFIYDTQSKNIEEILPEPLKPAPDPTVCVMIRNLHFPGTLGSYGETILNVLSAYEDKIGWYFAYIYCASDKALACGRELWGTPKKFGVTEITKRGSAMNGELKIGNDIMIEARVQLVTKIDRIEMMPKYRGREITNFVLKVIPNAVNGSPEIKQLISIKREAFTLKELWSCSGTISLKEAPGCDPTHKLSPKSEPRVFYDISDYILGYGNVVHNYL